MLDLIVSTLTQGFIYALLSYGVYITYKILDFPDLTVDGSFPLGAAVTALLLVNGVNPSLTLLVALAVGALAGLVTGLIHVKLATVIIGTTIFKKFDFVKGTTAAIAGSILYKICIQGAINLGLPANLLKLITAVLFLVILVLGNVKKGSLKKFGESLAPKTGKGR